MPNFLTDFYHQSTSHSKTTIWLIILILTILVFITLQAFYPLNNIASDTHFFYKYKFLEYLSTQLLVSVLLALLLANLILKYQHIMISVSLGAILGMLFFINVIGLTKVDPTQLDWLMRGDWQWHFLGWHLFKNDSWHWPLGQMNYFWFPVGTSIGYTDSIPLLALIFKPFVAFLPVDFQYIGLWLFICFILQGVFAALLMQLYSKNLLIQIIGTLFLIINPILLYRIEHSALCGHWLLLGGLWTYFKSWENASAYQPLKYWLLFTGLAATINPYLTAMVVGLAGAFYLRWWLVERRSTATAVISQLAILGITILCLWWLVGYFVISDKTNMAAHPLGHYSMNLLAPITPLGWSTFLKEVPFATEGQYEGFNYLGAGVLLMGLWAIYELIQRPIKWVTLLKVLPLILVSIGFTLFAISNKVTLGSQVLMEFHHELLEILAPFQSSGRFFWPVNYIIVFMILRLLIVRHSSHIALLYLSLGLLVQTLDLQAKHQTYRQARWESSQQSWEDLLKSDLWEFAAPYYQHITLLPPLACGEAAAPFQPFSYLAGRHGMTVNTGHSARLDTKKMDQYCQTLFANLREGKVADDSIYILHPRYLADFKAAAQQPVICAKIDGFDTCVTERSFLQWQGHYTQ